MKKIILLSIIFSCVCMGYAQKRIVGNKNIVTKTQTLAPFSVFRGGCSAEIRIIKSVENKAIVSIDENLIEYYHLEVINDELKLYKFPEVNCTHTQFSITIYTPHIKELDLSGSGNKYVSGFSERNFALKQQGSGNLVMENIIATNDLTFHHTGSGSVLLTNTTSTNFALEHSGSGNTDLADIIIKNDLTTKFTGSGSLKIRNYDIHNLTIDKSGSGDIHISNPNYSKYMDKLMIDHQSSGNISITNLLANKTNIKILSSGNVNLSGKTTEIIMNSNSTGNINARDLEAQIAHIENASVGNVQLTVTKKAYISDKGAIGKIKIFGEGEVSYTE